ncbi:MAG: PilN domain-containing protein [bacterium]
MAGKVLTSLAVRSRSLEWAVLHKAGEKQVLPPTRSVELELGENQKDLLAGIQAERDRLIEEIRTKCGRIPAPVSIGIPASWVLLRIAELPSGSPDEIKSMAELQIDKFSPFPIDESAFSYELLSEQNGRCRLLLSAIRTETINLLADALKAAGIEPKWVDINLLGWWQLLQDAGKVHAAGVQIFIILEDATCDLIITSAGIPLSMRSLSGMNDMPASEADEEIARETALTLASLDLDREGEQPASFTIWHRGDSPAGLIGIFESQFQITAHPEPLDSLPPLAEGLLKRTETRTDGRMDLAPVAWLQTETALRTKRRVILFSIIAASIWLTGMLALFGGLQFQRNSINSLTSELTELKAPAEKVKAIRERTQGLTKYMDRSFSGLECLREVSDRLPPGITLKSFNYHKNKNLEMSGEADEYALIADFKKDLERSKLFVASDLTRTRRTKEGKEEFKIICTLPGGEQP